jgi:5-methyltetrahydrofolate--homocysteine methyltransferase
MTRTGPPPQTGSLGQALSERVVVADGAMGTMLQASAATIDDFDGYEGCNEILNVTRPDIVSSVHEAYLEAGVDCVTTNTFGANLSNLGEYDIADRIGELSEAGARIARAAADRWSAPERPRSRPAAPAHRPGDHRDDRVHAARQRDRRRPHRP